MEGSEYEREQRLKAAAHYAIAKIAEEQAESLDIKVSKASVAVLSELFQGLAESTAVDLEAFAKHAKRTVIQPDDVKLCARRNESLLEHLDGLSSQMKEARAATASAAKKRKLKAGDGATNVTASATAGSADPDN